MWNGQTIKASKELVENHNREMSGLYGGGRSEPEEYQPGEPRGDDDDDEEDMGGAGGAEAAQRAATSGVDTESAQDRVPPSNNYKPINPRARDQNLNNTLMKLQNTMAALTSSFNTYGANSYNKATDQLRMDKFHGDLGGKIDGMSGDIRSLTQVLDTSLQNVTKHNRTYIDDNVDVIRTTAQEAMNTQTASSLALQNHMRDLIHSMTDNYNKDREMLNSIAAMTMDLSSTVSDLKTTLDNRGNYEMGQQEREYEMINQVKTLNGQISDAVRSMGEINVSDIISQFKSATGSDQVHGSLDRIKSLISEIVQSNQKHTLISSGISDKVQMMNKNQGRILDELRGEMQLLRTTLPSTATIDDLFNKMENKMDFQWANGLALNDEGFKKILEVVETIDTEQEVNVQSIHENQSILTKLAAQMNAKIDSINDMTQTAYASLVHNQRQIYEQIQNESLSTRNLVGEGVIFNESKSAELKVKMDELASNPSLFANAESKVDLSRGTGIVNSESKESTTNIGTTNIGNVPGTANYNKHLNIYHLRESQDYGANHMANVINIEDDDAESLAAEASAKAAASAAEYHNYKDTHMVSGKYSGEHKKYVNTAVGELGDEIYPWGGTVSENPAPFVYLLNDLVGGNVQALDLYNDVKDIPATTSNFQFQYDVSFSNPIIATRGFISETGGTGDGVDINQIQEISVQLMQSPELTVRLLGGYLNYVYTFLQENGLKDGVLENLEVLNKLVKFTYIIRQQDQGFIANSLLQKMYYLDYVKHEEKKRSQPWDNSPMDIDL
jgi:hypothetical protein